MIIENMLKVKTLNKDEFIKNHSLQSSMIELANPSYENPLILFNRDIQRCNKLYLVLDVNNNLLGFFMVTWEQLDNNTPSVFLRFSAVNSLVKSTGVGRLLYSAFIKDAQVWEKENLKKLLIWATTVTPFAYLAVEKLFIELEPAKNGTYSPHGENLALLIREKMNWNSNEMGHPFVLRNVAKGVHHSTIEKERIKKTIIDKKFYLFSQLKIDEPNGDRLLFICRIPAP